MTTARRAGLAALLAVVLGGCGGVTPVLDQPVAPRPSTQPAIPADANVIVTVSEAVPTPDDDVPAHVKVFVDREPAGQTATGPKSAPKAWGALLAPGNHAFRFEAWTLPVVSGDWTPLSVQWQPPERFIRVEPGKRTLVTLKFFDGGRRHSLQIERE